MRITIVSLLAINLAFAGLLASCNPDAGYQARPPSTVDSGAPPPRFRGDGEVRVRFVKPSRVAAECAQPGRDFTGYEVLGCTRLRSNGDHLMILPNACTVDPESVACHELGHLNGWPHDHGG